MGNLRLRKRDLARCGESLKLAAETSSRRLRGVKIFAGAIISLVLVASAAGLNNLIANAAAGDYYFDGRVGTNISADPAGDFYNPSKVATDDAGNVYVYDDQASSVSDPDTGVEIAYYKKVAVFAPDGTKIATRQIQTSGSGGSSSYGVYPSGLIVLPDDSLCFYGSAYNSGYMYALACYAPDSDQPQFVGLSYGNYNGSSYNLSCYGMTYDAMRDKFVCIGSLRNNGQSYIYARINRDGSIAGFFQESSSGVSMSAKSVATSNGSLFMTGSLTITDNNQNFMYYSFWKIAPDGTITPIVRQGFFDGNGGGVFASFQSVRADDKGNIYIGGYYVEYDNIADLSGGYEEYCAISRFSSSGNFTGCVAYYDGASTGDINSERLGGVTEGSFAVSSADYNVYATYSGYSSSYSSVTVIKKYAIETATPDAPLNVVAENPSVTTIEVSWRAPEFDGYAKITGYEIRYRAAGAGEWQVAKVGANDFSTTLANLKSGAEYEIQVFAVNANGLGAASNIAKAKTLPSDNIIVTTPTAPNAGLPLF